MSSDIRAPLQPGERLKLSASMQSFTIMIFVWISIEISRFWSEIMVVARKIRRTTRRLRDDGSDEEVASNLKDFIRGSYFVTAQIPILSALILFSEWRSKIELDGSPNSADPVFIPIAVVVCVQAVALGLNTCQNSTLQLLNLSVQAVSKLSLVIMSLIVLVRAFEAKKAEPYVAEPYV